jgi:hypothetical protein
MIIETEKINSIEYLEVISIYLDSFLRITQFPETVPRIKKVLEYCKLPSNTKKIEEPIAVFEKVIIPLEAIPEKRINRDIFQIEEEEENEADMENEAEDE